MKMTKYDRLLFIMNLLRSRRNLNAAHLADECEVTERTIYRDIVSLSEANIPIYYDRGYKYASNNFLPPLNFNIEEYLTLKNILESSPLNSSASGKRIIKDIKTKIEAVLNPELKKQKYYFEEHTEVKIKTTHAGRSVENVLATIEQAIRNRTALYLEYNSIESGIRERVVEPYFIVFRERTFYFVGYCRLRGEFRTFRADRVLALKSTGEKFHKNNEINARDYFKSSWGIYKGEPVKMEIRFFGKAARVVRLGRHHSSEEIEKRKDDSIIYRVTVDGHEEITRWVLGFGREAIVLKPKWLANLIKKISHKTFQNYK